MSPRPQILLLGLFVTLTGAATVSGQCYRWELENLASTRDSDQAYDVDADGDVMVVGELLYPGGHVAVFRRVNDVWQEEAILDSTLGLDGFGYLVELAGPVLMVGGLTPSGPSPRPLVVEVFRHDGSTWNFEQSLTPDREADDCISLALRADGQAALIGAGSVGSYQGAAYYYEYDGATWNQLQVLTVNGTQCFGAATALGADVAVVAEVDEYFKLQNDVYEFRRDASGKWFERRVLLSLTPGDLPRVNLDGTSLLIGVAPLYGTSSSSVLAFTDTGTDFTFQEAFPPTPFGSLVGYSMDQDGEFAVFRDWANMVHVYHNDGGWTYHSRFLARDYYPDRAVAMTGRDVFWAGHEATWNARVGRYSLDWTLEVQPPSVGPFSNLIVSTRLGKPGTLAMLAVTEVNGGVTFLPVQYSILDACGDWNVYQTVAPGLSGITLKLRAFGQDLNGEFSASSPQSLTFN